MSSSSTNHSKSDINVFTAVNPMLSMRITTVLCKYQTECKIKFKLNMLHVTNSLTSDSKVFEISCMNYGEYIRINSYHLKRIENSDSSTIRS
jgi:hypothetical protein